MKVSFQWAASLSGSFFLLCAPLAAAADHIVGTWIGDVDQPGYGSYSVVMTITSVNGGSIQYPSLGCGGALSGGGSGGVYQYAERITYGAVTVDSEGNADGCIDGGSINAVLQGDRLFWEWKGSYRSEAYYASGKLTRSGASEVVKTCAECGEALMNDIDYGLGQSQGFRNYVHEARQNYSNCIRDIADGCWGTPGRQLYDNLPACDQFNEDGYKSCVETTLRGARLSNP